MKKVIFGSFIAASFALMTVSFNVNAEGTRGSQLVRAETSECESGVMRNCTGSGDFCDNTVGWDCEQPQIQ